MAADKVQLVTDITRVGVGSAGTVAVWAANLDMAVRIGVGLLTIAYLAIAIYHRIKHWHEAAK